MENGTLKAKEKATVNIPVLIEESERIRVRTKDLVSNALELKHNLAPTKNKEGFPAEPGPNEEGTVLDSIYQNLGSINTYLAMLENEIENIRNLLF